MILWQGKTSTLLLLNGSSSGIHLLSYGTQSVGTDRDSSLGLWLTRSVSQSRWVEAWFFGSHKASLGIYGQKLGSLAVALSSMLPCCG